MFAMKCDNCGTVFYENDFVLESVGDGRVITRCPNCGSEDFEDGAICNLCGEFVNFDYNGICKDCLMDEASDIQQTIEYGKSDGDNGDVTINGLFAYVYSPEEINDILMADFLRLPEEKQKEFTRRYVCNDEYCFADWLKEKEEKNGND